VKTAIVHDWLVTYAGAERVLAEIIKLFPEADLFSIVDFFPTDARHFLMGKKARSSFIQKLPLSKKKYRSYLPLMPLAVEGFDLRPYELVISCSHSVAKGVLTSHKQKHICYCFTPMRYAWDLNNEYLAAAGLQNGIKGFFVKTLLHYMRIWDAHTAARVDHFIAPSNYIAARIKKIYGRESTVLYPPVDTEKFRPGAGKDSPNEKNKKENYYVTASRLVPYKRVDLLGEAFSELGRTLLIIGEGPELKKMKGKVKENVKLMGFLPEDSLIRHFQKARAFVYAADEDFGIAPLEAQACGTPVICYGAGGLLETIRNGRTGIFYKEQTKDSIKKAVKEFEEKEKDLHASLIRANAERFSRERFQTGLKEFFAKIKAGAASSAPTYLEK
jgi:glycosyltransferase involved in cell wall biosynthesis